ncbi:MULTISPECIES: polyprenyl synthetase family protein [unclassified Streptomyces]|uniref:polyprenyl synthetase family protein n=1 Tax=unclassified Streptomyces TaxID=2593676 RepID=UPI00365B2A5C
MGRIRTQSTAIADRAEAGSGLLARLCLDDPEFEARMGEALAGAEQRLHDCARAAEDPRIADLTGHLASAGGKRMRPVLVLLGAEFGDPWRHGVIQAAVIAELVHISSLYHDDVMDEAATRHGVPSANVRWGRRAAVFGGDWLLARSAQLAADLGPHALRLNAETAGRLVAGQLRELTGPAPDEDPIDHYFEVTAGKTAALLAMSLGIGALQAAAPEPYVRALTTYGEHLGAAFQIADDLLDLTGPAEVTGKERGKDLLAGVPSLPVLLALADRSPGNEELRNLLLDGPVTDPVAHGRALELFTVARATAQAEAMMHQRLAGARDALGTLPQRTARRALDALCDFVAFRTS